MKKILQLVLLAILIIAASYSILAPASKKEEVEATNGAPSFSLVSITGETIDLASYEDGVILNFWATYCPPCKREMPAFEEAYETLQQDGIQLFAINVGEPKMVVNQYLQTLKPSFPVLLDRDGLVSKSYEVLTLPTTVFIKSGKIVQTVKGELTEEQLLQYAQMIQ